MSELHSNIKQTRVIGPVAIGANATKSGKVIDRQGYYGVEFVVSYGAVTTTGSIVTLVMKEGDVTGTLTSVADGNMLGTEALAGLAAGARTSGTGQNVVKRVGYKGIKRYVTIDSVSTGTTSVGCIGVAAVLYDPETAPISNP